jgi:addiction module HigA family antidote
MGNGFWPEQRDQRDWTSAPGETIQDLLVMRGISLKDLAIKMLVSPDELRKIVYEAAEIEAGMAEKLARALGPSVEFWLAREKNYRDDLIRLAKEKEKEKEKERWGDF